MNIAKKLFFQALVIGLLLTSCNFNQDNAKQSQNASDSYAYTPKKYVELKHPDWSRNASIYEVNVRQYTAEGTFKAFEQHLPRLKNMGIDIIWFMPIHPIGVLKRKGTLGSEYSVKDYYAVNPEFGTMDDLRSLVKKNHGIGMHVIVDWVGNHSAWDNALAKEHPDWYTKTPEGNFQPTPWYDWDDVIDFDYNVPAMRRYMTDALKYWVKEADIDGYRCDVAGFIPVDFWENVRQELETIKPVFMLAEWESRDLHKRAFDMTYAWSLWDKMKDACSNGKGIAGLVEYLAHDVNNFPREAYRMTFTDNHDKNSWEGNQFSNFGPGLATCIVLACTVNGMPLVYSGQEAGLNKSLKFFDKDSIDWKPHPFYEMYQTLFDLKHRNKALWNGEAGGEMIRIFNNKPSQVISFYRQQGDNRVIPVLNFSAQPVTVILNSEHLAGSYTELFSNTRESFTGKDTMQLSPWGYKVFFR